MSATWMLASDGVGLAYWSSTHSFSRLWKNITKWSRAIKIYLLSDWEAYLVSLSRDGFVLQLHSWFLKKKSRCPFCIYLVNFRSFLTCVWGEGGWVAYVFIWDHKNPPECFCGLCCYEVFGKEECIFSQPPAQNLIASLRAWLHMNYICISTSYSPIYQ